MNGEQISIVCKAAKELFWDNKEYILEEWSKRARQEYVDENEIEFIIIRKSFDKLINDFISFLSEGDLESYYERNAYTAKALAYYNLSFKSFLNYFHLFEDSYLPLLVNLPKSQLLKYMTALDKLHHNTIAIVSEKYFEVKDSLVESLAKLIELRDDETGGHIERTSEYSVLLAKELDLNSEFIDELSKASILHDIGKVGVRDNILLKRGVLTREEFEEVKRHPSIGAQTIDRIISNQEISKGYLLMARDISLYHHEKYNGTGYPLGLKGEEIPIAARILALADAYDAIVSERPYKSALPHEEAVKRIKMDAGKHFDPVIVNIFLRVSNKFKGINDGFHEML